MIVSLARDNNDWRKAGHLFVLADGMGAHAAGELASKIAVDQVAHIYRKRLDDSPVLAISDAIREANDEIHKRGQANMAFHNMGTTCSALVLLPHGALLAHVGDSRGYRLRDGHLEQLTFDHSLVWEMQLANKSTDLDTTSIPKNIITRSLGPHPRVKVDLEGPFPIEMSDTFLLCSDGLTGCVSDEEIASVLALSNPKDATQLLIDMALMRGAPDNVTLIAAKVSGRELTTGAFRTAPMVVAKPSHAKSRAPTWAWIVFGTLLLFSGVLGALGMQTWSLTALAVSALPGFAILALETGLLDNGPDALGRGERLGKAPYRFADAESAEEFARVLAATIGECQTAALAKAEPADRSAIEKLLQSSNEHLVSGRVDAALQSLRQASRAVGELSREIER